MSPPLRIAIADDESEIRDHYSKIIKRLGHEVVAAVDTGNALIEVCQRLHPDLIITDVHMPGLDGDQAVREVWKCETIPTILISAYDQPKDFPPAGINVAWAYLSKPVKRLDFEAAIRATMNTATFE
ncbi:MAG TPA: response regulator [Gemmatales bacterium]|nr:response regulator [Gemmatales bacterium]